MRQASEILRGLIATLSPIDRIVATEKVALLRQLVDELRDVVHDDRHVRELDSSLHRVERAIAPPCDAAHLAAAQRHMDGMKQSAGMLLVIVTWAEGRTRDSDGAWIPVTPVEGREEVANG